MARAVRSGENPTGDGDALTVVDALAQLAFVMTGVLSEIAAEAGSSLVQARLLGIVRDRDVTITELATILRLDKSSVTGLVDRASQRELVERIPSTVDGRSVVVRITPHGQRLVRRAARQYATEVDTLLAHVSSAHRQHLVELASEVMRTYTRRI